MTAQTMTATELRLRNLLHDNSLPWDKISRIINDRQEEVSTLLAEACSPKRPEESDFSFVDATMKTQIIQYCRSFGKRSEYGMKLGLEWSFRSKEVERLEKEVEFLTRQSKMKDSVIHNSNVLINDYKKLARRG